MSESGSTHIITYYSYNLSTSKNYSCLQSVQFSCWHFVTLNKPNPECTTTSNGEYLLLSAKDQIIRKACYKIQKRAAASAVRRAKVVLYDNSITNSDSVQCQAQSSCDLERRLLPSLDLPVMSLRLVPRRQQLRNVNASYKWV